jgi:predicted Fe-Mo cluster-binding NifX family protein
MIMDKSLKIGISLKKDGRNLDESFSSAKLFGVADSGTGKVDVFSDEDIEKKFPGKTFSSIMKELNISAVITKKYNPMLLKLFISLGIKTYKSEKEEISKIISLFNSGNLTEANYYNIESNYGCNSETCASCSSDSCS